MGAASTRIELFADDSDGEHGLEAVPTETIITRPRLSTGAVYDYPEGKNEIIKAAITEGRAALTAQGAPIIGNPGPPNRPSSPSRCCVRPSPSAGRRAASNAAHRPPRLEPLLARPELKTATRATRRRLRNAFADTARRRQTLHDPSRRRPRRRRRPAYVDHARLHRPASTRPERRRAGPRRRLTAFTRRAGCRRPGISPVDHPR